MWNRPNYSSADRETLIERITQLENEAGMGFDIHPRYGFTARETMMLGIFAASHSTVTREHCYDLMYAMHDDPPEPKIFDVYLSKLRTKLRPLGIEITTVWGRGWYMEPEDKAKLLALAVKPAPVEVEGVAA